MLWRVCVNVCGEELCGGYPASFPLRGTNFTKRIRVGQALWSVPSHTQTTMDVRSFVGKVPSKEEFKTNTTAPSAAEVVRKTMEEKWKIVMRRTGTRTQAAFHFIAHGRSEVVADVEADEMGLFSFVVGDNAWLHMFHPWWDEVEMYVEDGKVVLEATVEREDFSGDFDYVHDRIPLVNYTIEWR